MDETAVENLKKEISEYYIKDFKKQLGWFKSIAILPIQKSIKNILIGKENLPETFDEVKEFGRWKDIINFVSPKLANKIFEFMKNKRLEIENRKTEAELIQLKNEILGLKQETDINSGLPESAQTVEIETSGELEPEVETDTDINLDTKETELLEGNGNNGKENGNQNIGIIENSENETVDSESETENSEESRGINSIAAGVGTAVVGGAGVKVLENVANKNLIEVDAVTMKSYIDDVINYAENKKIATSHRLTTVEEKNIDKYISKLKEGKTMLNDAQGNDIIKALNQLGDDFKLPRNLLEKCGLRPSQLDIISKYSDELAKIESLEDFKLALKSHGINSINDDVAEALFNVHDATKIKNMSILLKNGNKVPRILQTLAGALRVDVACTGLDVWNFFDQKKEAELLSKINELAGKSKMDQAWTQLGIGVSSVVIEGILIWLAGSSAGGPVGVLIGLAVGAVTTLASYGVDTLYYDVRNFYEKNQDQFLRQTRAELKQAILQGIHNKKEGDTSINEQITTSITPRLKPGGETKEKSLNDACISMIFLEEIGDYGELANNLYLWEYVRSNKTKQDFLSDKIKEIKSNGDENSSNETKEQAAQEYKNQFEQSWKIMEERINIRMEYIKKEFEKPDIIASLDRGTGMRDLTILFTKSRAFADLKKDGKRDNTISFEKNVENYKTDLLSKFSIDKVRKFEELRQDNPSLFEDIINTVELDSFIPRGEEESYEDQNYIQNVKIVVAYKEYLNLTTNIEDKTHIKFKSRYNAKFIENVLKSDFDENKANCVRISGKTLVSATIARNEERYYDSDISDDIFQNILYRLARELYGYDGKNDKLEIIHFYNEKVGDAHGIYFDSKWMANYDNAIDSELSIDVFNIKTLEEKDVDVYVDKFMDNFFSNHIVSSRGASYSSTNSKESIDTATESIDDKLNKEFRLMVKQIVNEELNAHTVENQSKIKEKIYDFVKRCGNGEKYLELPGYLIIEAKKAGLGDISRQYFRYKDGKIEICFMPSEVNQKLIFDDCEKYYITPARTEFTQEEKYYIDRVDTAYSKLENILNEDLGLPVELHDIVVSKKNEWEKMKENSLLYEGKIVANLSNKYKQFAEYFENLYRGILITISGFSISNDISNVNYFNMAMSYGNQNIFDKEGNLLEVNEENGNTRNELGKQSEFINLYNQQIETLKIGEKTIKELWMSEDKSEKELAYRTSNMIYTTVLEFSLIDNDGKIHPGNEVRKSYNSYGGLGYTICYKKRRCLCGDGSRGIKIDQDKINKVSKIVENKIKGIEISPKINEAKINNLRKEQVIRKLSKEEKNITDAIPQLQGKIENIGKDINRKGKRGDILYDTEKSVIKSRGNEVKVESLTENTIRLKGLDSELTLQEGVRLANFKNRIKNKYPDKKTTFERSYINRSLSLSKTFHIDDTMLITRGDLENLCPICSSDEVMEKITEWLNKD